MQRGMKAIHLNDEMQGEHMNIKAQSAEWEQRFKDLEKMMAYIDEENYHDKAIATQQGRQVVQKWSELSDLLVRHQVLLAIKTW